MRNISYFAVWPHGELRKAFAVHTLVSLKCSMRHRYFTTIIWSSPLMLDAWKVFASRPQILNVLFILLSFIVVSALSLALPALSLIASSTMNSKKFFFFNFFFPLPPVPWFCSPRSYFVYYSRLSRWVSISKWCGSYYVEIRTLAAVPTYGD